MLTLYSGGKGYPIKNDDYYIRQLSSGLNEIVFNISIRDELYPLITEEASIQDRDQMYFLVKQIDAGNDTAKVVGQIDLDEWKSSLSVGYTNGSASVGDTVQGVCPGNWTVVDRSGKTFKRTVTGDYTPFDVVYACVDVYKVQFIWDNKNRTITIVDPESYQPLGAFATRDLNLKELNYKGKSQTFATRLYAYGSEGLSFADINDNKPYVDDNTYSNRIICAYWEDERYTVKENLLADAKTNLKAMAIPQRSYDCEVVDLAATNPGLYSHQNFSLFSVVSLIDDAKEVQINHQVVERWEYPYYPVKNKVVLSTQVPKIQNQVTQVVQQIQNPNSNFRQQQQAAIDNATGWIVGNKGGYVVFHKNDQGQPDEILIMDTPDIATATKVWRWNNSGLGYSSNGYNGPYALAMTQDGSIVADFITTGELSANRVRAGLLESNDGNTYFDLDNSKIESAKWSVGVGDILDITEGNVAVSSQHGTSGTKNEIAYFGRYKGVSGNVIGSLELLDSLSPGKKVTVVPDGVTMEYPSGGSISINTATPNSLTGIFVKDSAGITKAQIRADYTVIDDLTANALTVAGRTAAWFTITDDHGNTYYFLGQRA